MLTIIIPEQENYDEATQKFVIAPSVTVQIEHSLASLSKWEGIWEKPFLSDVPKTSKEAGSYIECMVVNTIPEGTLSRLTSSDKSKISKHIEAKMTATWFSNIANRPPSREIITAEIIYFWLVTLTIPFDPCQDWHLNRLLALVKTCNLKNAPPKKMNTSDAMARQRELNAQRQAQLQTKG